VRLAIGVVAALLVLALAACESSQDKSARLAKQGGKAFTRKGLEVRRQNPDVKVGRTFVLQDQNGAATVVELRNISPQRLVNVPVSIDVLGAGKQTVFKNDAPGLEPSLTAAALLEPRSEFTWVNDQVTPSGRAKAVDVKIGAAPLRAPRSVPELALAKPTLKRDPVSGMEASGSVTNRSKVEQRALIVYCVARRGSRVVAAGRSAIQRLKPGQKLFYHVYFIGDPSGASLSVEAPPTVLQ
jgi:hypothetical protein